LNTSQQAFALPVIGGELRPATGLTFDAATAASATRGLTIALIDHFRFSQECLVSAFASLHPSDVVLPYAVVQDCIAGPRQDLDLIVYYSHDFDIFQSTTIQNVAAVHRSFPSVPLIVLSDSATAQEPSASRSMLESGAQGFIPTRTTGIFIAIGAIRLVKAGGVFAPSEPPVARVADRAAPVSPALQQRRLTAREVAVLGHLQRGNANKIIAHELGMSENTVKIHVRNIIRKMEATNRTQAVYKARTLWQPTA